MINDLLQILATFWDKIMPFVIVEQWNKGVWLRFGKLRGSVDAGFYWKIPFFDSITEISIAVTTEELGTQSLITLDEKNIVLNSVVKYQVSDAVVFCIEVANAVSAISDMTKGIIKNIVMESTWEQCKSNQLDAKITGKAKNEAEKWGIKIIKVTLTDLAPIKSIRLISDKPLPL